MKNSWVKVSIRFERGLSSHALGNDGEYDSYLFQSALNAASLLTVILCMSCCRLSRFQSALNAASLLTLPMTRVSSIGICFNPL